ncbi:restriction endonuclease subunit S [Rhodococcus sp. NPDC060084]|uniref:restriction endonuclease subunit S n=1 Tax=Rhodococcus sp. NPDC060084 TaxID=3347053 RepID=UPI0036692CC6
MSRVDDLVSQLCPEGVEHRALRDVGTWYGGGTPSKSVPEYWANGTVPWLSPKDMNVDIIRATEDHISEEALQKTTVKLVPAGSVAFVIRSNVLRRRFPVALVPFEVTLNQDMRALVPYEGIIVEYLALVCRARADTILSIAGRMDGSMAAIQSGRLLDFRIPIPPPEIQQEVVAKLSRFAELETELETSIEAELGARQQQHSRSIDVLLEREAEMIIEDSVPLGDLVDFINGKPHERLVVPVGSVALLTARFISTSGRLARWVNPENALTPARVGDIAMVMSDLPNGRALARCFYVEEDGKYTANQRVCLLRIRDRKNVSPRWLYHFLDRNPQILAYDNGQDQTHLKKTQILDVKVPVIPIAEQERKVVALDQLDASARDLMLALESEREARRKQFEYYRDKLLTFEELMA